ncbi:uncharacterized protein LOC110860331 [Folsomia candida]|uniref:uncharacterized protein LOC110860331 n=1 Tax=Folsomia candida TaxID=158441 RepID=UPI0016055B3D|nr:uncharacterized protein LOC110860331 [Folsomia candida]
MGRIRIRTFVWSSSSSSENDDSSFGTIFLILLAAVFATVFLIVLCCLIHKVITDCKGDRERKRRIKQRDALLQSGNNVELTVLTEQEDSSRKFVLVGSPH